ncbi:MAG: hypothetical protein KKA54_04265 [Proteobacteria bacterium]|nr:hypothetical protein [Pseudomonadota bacterium]
MTSVFFFTVIALNRLAAAADYAAVFLLPVDIKCTFSSFRFILAAMETQ